MTTHDDPLRRGDVPALVRSHHPANGACCFEDPDGHSASVSTCDGIAELVDAMPVDRVAAAAWKLAEVILAKERDVMADPFAVFDRGPFGERVMTALAALHAAIAARDAGTVPPATVAEADDDVVLRADVFAALDKRMEREEYGHAKAAVALDIEAVGRIPKRKVRVDPVAKAERKVARAMLAWYGISRLSVSAEEYRAVEAEGAAAIEELRAAVAARDAGTAPPAPKPAPACARCGGSGYLCPVCSRSECFQGAPCPECRGKP